MANKTGRTGVLLENDIRLGAFVAFGLSSQRRDDGSITQSVPSCALLSIKFSGHRVDMFNFLIEAGAGGQPLKLYVSSVEIKDVRELSQDEGS